MGAVPDLVDAMTAAVQHDLRFYVQSHTTDPASGEEILTLRMPKTVMQVHIARGGDNRLTGNVLIDATPPWPPQVAVA